MKQRLKRNENAAIEYANQWHVTKDAGSLFFVVVFPEAQQKVSPKKKKSIHTHTHTHIEDSKSVCVCVCVYKR